MAATHPLRRVDPLVHRGVLYRVFVGFVSSRFMCRLSRTRLWALVVWRIDPHLMRLTRGRLGTGFVLRTALLETRGARTGRSRTSAVVYFHDGDAVIVVASQAGRPDSPSWFYNARANPDVRLAGRPFRAEQVVDETERARLWELADRVLPAFARYRETAGAAGRTIPILRLVPATA
jgi:deazaflavin-dependent oxidoreductase (nitroreductase family)